MLVIEDVHWADEATLDVLTLLATRIATAPALVLASYRDDELDRAAQLRFVLGEIARRPARLKVEVLSPTGVAELAAPHGVDADELFRRTGGNPFFVSEVLAAGGAQMPDTVRDAVLARAARLSEPARRVLEAVAIVPGPTDVALLERLAAPHLDHVDECLASGMLAAGATHVEFRHELARHAVEEATPPHRRLALHKSALAALPETAEPARLAHHADAANDKDAVLRHAPEAAARAGASGAHREAAAQYARALRYAGDLPPADRAQLLNARADECYLSADFDAAITAQRAALSCHRELHDVRGEGDSLRSLSRLLFFAGRTEEGEPVVLEAVRLLEQLPPGHELAMAYGNVAQRRSAVEDRAAAIEWAERGQEIAQQLDDTEAYVYTLTTIGGAEFQVDWPEARHKLEHALRLAREHGLDEYVGRAYLQLVLGAQRTRRYDVAGANLDAGIAYCEEHGLDTWRAYLQARHACQALDRGDWDEAADTAATVLRDPRAPGLARGWALTVRGLVRARRGDAEAEAPLAEAHELGHTDGRADADRAGRRRPRRARLAGGRRRRRRTAHRRRARARARARSVMGRR